MLTDRFRREMLRNAVRDARQSAGLQQIDVAEQLGKPQSSIAKSESGDRMIEKGDALNVCRDPSEP